MENFNNFIEGNIIYVVTTREDWLELISKCNNDTRVDISEDNFDDYVELWDVFGKNICIGCFENSGLIRISYFDEEFAKELGTSVTDKLTRYVEG